MRHFVFMRNTTQHRHGFRAGLVFFLALAIGAIGFSAQAQFLWFGREKAKAFSIAVLLPFDGQDTATNDVALDLWDAALLAQAQAGKSNIKLLPFNTYATAQGTLQAIEEARAAKADFILGPLLTSSLAGIASLQGDHPPILAFSNSPQPPSPNLWIWGHLPQTMLSHLLPFAVAKNRSVLAALLPRNDFGNRLAKLLPILTRNTDMTLYGIERYHRSASAMNMPVRRIAAYDSRRQTLDARRAEAEQRNDRRTLAALNERETWGRVAYDSIVLADTGDALINLASLLPFYDVDMREVKVLLPQFWHKIDAKTELPLRGAWYASAPPQRWNNFAEQFRQQHQRTPHRLASLAYDGVQVALQAHRLFGKVFTPEQLHQITIDGVDGRARLTKNGTNDRLLTIYEITEAGDRVIAPAPNYFFSNR